ncbi:hypothetical protein [Xylocopilactobacillus apicola]|uniref:Uncharacterized protein n=1 Tax=Xylocopilactobacillus apicola TaxID=2932184 RepID=A0AAU9DLK2_9LACO|nr:hypothetical protein [Xylocopilactobacillus apicola]BDR59431.1 hypothetical protein XA3_18720 [Xylocopilactobacillus apicola]
MLKDPELLALARDMANTMENAMKNIIKECEQDIRKCELSWDLTHKAAIQMAPLLSQKGGIESALIEGGYTQTQVLVNPIEKYKEEMNAAEKFLERFKEIKQKLESSAKQIQSSDEEVAGYFR